MQYVLKFTNLKGKQVVQTYKDKERRDYEAARAILLGMTNVITEENEDER